MFAPASSRTVPRFHFSTFTALTVCCTVSSEDFRIAEGVTGAAGASCAGVPLAGACTADATEAEQTIVNINTAWLIGIFSSCYVRCGKQRHGMESWGYKSPATTSASITSPAHETRCPQDSSGLPHFRIP